MLLEKRNIFGIEDLSKEEIEFIFEETKKFKQLSKKDVKASAALKGRTVINIFFENSTRTRTSFELAGKRLGADVINISVSTSAIKKGESLMDTAKTLDAMHTDVYILRHSIAGTAKMFAKYVKGSVIDAGDGANEHPTQALLDAFTILEKKGTLEGLKVAIVGDIVHSRVAKSNIYLLKKYGAEITLVGPRTLVPKEFEQFGVKISDRLDDVIEEVDVINLLRIQTERQEDSFFPSIKEYHDLYGMNKKRLEKTKKDVLIMHPGPMNRGVEISFDVADCERQVILDQVENGLAVRMALLKLILEGSNA